MALRLVVCVRWRPPPTVDSVATRSPEETWSFVLRALVERATALGGRIVGWHDGYVSVDFAVDALQDAVDLLVDEPLGASLSCGLAHGELEECLESHRIALCTGEVLTTAAALAGYARPGEVLVTPELVEAAAGELLTTGPAKKREGREEVAAFSLDLVHPLRSLLMEAVARITDPPWLGEAASLVGPFPGQVLLVRGAPGGGGTRWLEELSAGRDDTLWVRPGRTGWPGSALLQTLKGAAAATVAELEALLRGVARPLVLVDDADEVDRDSLEILARCCAAGAFGLVLRVLDEDAAVPRDKAVERLFAGTTLLAEHVLEPLSGAAAAKLAAGATGGSLGPAQLAAVEASPGGGPLRIVEQLTHALDSGDWLWSGESIQPRSHAPLAELPVEGYLAGRLQRLPLRSRLVLEALAVLGGSADPRDTARLLRAATASDAPRSKNLLGPQGPITPDEVMGFLSALVASRWLRARPFRLASATARRVILGEAPPERLRALHAGAARVGVQSGAWAGRASAVVHATLIGRVAQARDLARSAEPLVREAGSVASADALSRLAEEGETGALRARGYLPQEQQVEGSASELMLDWSGMVGSPPPPAASLAARPGVTSGSAAPLNSEAPSVSEGPAGSLPSDAAEPYGTAEVAAAVTRRDHAALRAMGELARGRGQVRLSERLLALSELAQGRSGEALARLRRAKERAADSSLSEQCRAELSLAVALAVAGRAEEALFRALFGLARAREAGDPRGERACARFLGGLSSALGSAHEAAQWQSIADAESPR